jgi:hypothetical protein
MRISHNQLLPVIATERPFGQDLNIQNVQDEARQNSPHPTSAPLDVRIQNTQYQGDFDYPSPSASSFENPNFSNVGFATISANSPLSPPPMLPPMRGISYNSPSNRQHGESTDSIYKRHKRSHSAESPATSTSLSTSETYSPLPGPLTPYSPFVMPLTPSSSVGPDEHSMRSGPMQPSMTSPPTDLRRLSVQSLLTGPPGDSPQLSSPDVRQVRQYPRVDSTCTTYGYDLGLPDLDIPKNDDTNAIAIFSPPSGTMGLEDENPYGNAEVRSQDMAFEKGGYYTKPVPIKISKSLEPLPQLILETPMNLLYFHHFLNHTARILVPHDCEQNPFRQILPESTSSTSYLSFHSTKIHSGRPRRKYNEPPPRL